MKKTILYFVSCILLTSFSANASVSIDAVFPGIAGQDSLRIYVNYSACTDTDRVCWLKYGQNLVNFTANQQMQLGSGQLSYLITGLTPATDVPVRACHWRTGESLVCTVTDTFTTANPPYVTTVDITGWTMSDTGLMLAFNLNTTAPATLQPVWNAALSIGANPFLCNVVSYGATSGTQAKTMLVKNPNGSPLYFAVDTYAVAIRFQNDSLLQAGQFGWSDTIVAVLSGVNELNPLAGVFIPTIISNQLMINLEKFAGRFMLIDGQGRIANRVLFKREVLEMNLASYPPGMYFCQIVTEDGFTKNAKLLIVR